MCVGLVVFMVGIKMSIGEKGQVVIPKPLREEFNLNPNDMVEFDQEGDKIVVKKVSSKDPIKIFLEIKKRMGKFTEKDFKKIDFDKLYDQMMVERLKLRELK